MPISSCDEDRLKLSQKAQEMFSRGGELAKTENHEEALDCLLFAFDNGSAVDGWGGVRLSYIPAAIATLGKSYEPAITALQLRRNAREELVRTGERSFDVVSEWISLNRYLMDKDREIALMKELEKAKTLDDELKNKIIDSNFERLLEERNYKILAACFDHFGNRFLHTIFHYERLYLFPEKLRSEVADSLLEHSRKWICDQGSQIFELALGIKKVAQANEIRSRILTYCNDQESYTKLVNAALRAGNKKQAAELKKYLMSNSKSGGTSSV